MKITAGLYRTAGHRAKRLLSNIRLRGKHQMSNLGRGMPTLVYVLAGYKPELWPIVFPRLQAALPQDADVCLVSPGLFSDELSGICTSHGWSYISTTTNDVSLAQNICLNLHDKAEIVVKIDEDMLLLPHTLKNLLRHYAEVKAEGIINPGFVAPLIPLNGFCHRYVLETLGLLEDYEALFGRARLATDGMPLTTDPQAARWIWEHTAPLEDTAARLRAAAHERSLVCPVRFSIGMIAFERSFWKEIGYFPVHRAKLMAGVSTLGADESYLCRQAVELSRPGLVHTGSLAGHFSFGAQYQSMKAFLHSNPRLFETPPPAAKPPSEPTRPGQKAGDWGRPAAFPVATK